MGIPLERGGAAQPLSGITALRPVLDRLVVVSDDRFSNIVEDQLEVRTSVSISPETGAAEEGALFTAEALPRACFLFFNVTYLNPVLFRVPAKNQNQEGREVNYGNGPAGFADVQATVHQGLGMMEFLGIGGVNTRGMGRLRALNAA